MRSSLASLLALTVLAAGSSAVRVADACGGCFVQQQENTQVSGHRMVLSIAPERTTLWDQIQYVGDPASFAWVLPIKGTVTVGLSSDAMFASLEARTRVDVISPQLNCAQLAAQSASAYAPTSEKDSAVTVLAEAVVGPYETVQLASSDPNALRDWLSQRGYAVPADVAPVIDAYVAEAFNFLALKLVPGQGVQAMKPVRVTSKGASPTLPLRMVAAGTGAITPITLWVMAEGRHEPANFPSFTIGASSVIWDWDTRSSNYAKLKQAMFDATSGRGWLVEAAEPLSKYDFGQGLLALAEDQPEQSGYAGSDGQGALQAVHADLEALFGAIEAGSLWVTRMHAELARQALATDLAVQPSADQSTLPRQLVASSFVGTPPCPGLPSSRGAGSPPPASTGATAITPDPVVGAPADPEPPTASGGGGCALGGHGGLGALAGAAALALALGAARRRRGRR